MYSLARQVDRPGILFRVALAAGEKSAFVGASDGKLYEVGLASEPMAVREFTGHSGYVLGFVRAGDVVVSGAYDGKLIWRLADSGEVLRTIDAHQKWIRNLATSPDGKLVASVGDDMVCRLWNASSGELVRELRGHELKTPHHFPSMLFACAFSADGSLLATGDKIGRVVIWNVASGERAGQVEAAGLYTWDPRQRIHSIGGARSLAFSPDGSQLAVGGIGAIDNIDHLDAPARVEIFDWRSNKRLHELSGKHKGLVERLAFDPAGQTLLIAGGDHGGFLEVFSLSDGKSLWDEKAPMHIHDFAFNESRDKLVTAGHGKLAVWEAKPRT